MREAVRAQVSGKLRVDHRQRDAVESQVPGGVPGIFPLVRHGQHVGVIEVQPVAVAAMMRSAGGGG